MQNKNGWKFLTLSNFITPVCSGTNRMNKLGIFWNLILLISSVWEDCKEM